ncbi:MAG: OmpA family protein [Saprospiraceae bacterium]
MRWIIFTALFFIQKQSFAQWVLDSMALKKAVVTNEVLINSKHMESSPVNYKEDYVLLVKSNNDGPKDENGEYYFDLVYAAKNGKGQLARQAFLPFSVNSNKHEGQAAYDALTEKLYFTRSWYDEERGTHKDTIVLKIYEARESNQYANPVVLPFCSDKYDVCHPTLSRNGNVMFFSSNMPGSAKMDLYRVEKTGKSWGVPVKLPSSINGIANEVFPYLYRDSILFFSSDRTGGSGGFDIFYSQLKDTSWSAAMLLPYPVNSSFDDIGFLINDRMNGAYFSSNRPGGKGKDDIYHLETISSIFIREEPVKMEMQAVVLSVIDKLSFLPVEGARVVLDEIAVDANVAGNSLQWVGGQGEKGEVVVKIQPEILTTDERFSDADGTIKLSLNKSGKYLIRSFKTGYQEEVILYQPSKDGAENTIVMNPLPEAEPVKEEKPVNLPAEAAVGSVFVFNSIFYDYNSSSLKEDAIADLNTIYDAMTVRPEMKIQLSAHTDARGNALYNKQLSEQRAKAAKKYLVDKGIAASRIITIGFGESRIRNHCKDGVTCTEDEHLFNRRTEVLILE